MENNHECRKSLITSEVQFNEVVSNEVVQRDAFTKEGIEFGRCTKQQCYLVAAEEPIRLF